MPTTVTVIFGAIVIVGGVGMMVFKRRLSSFYLARARGHALFNSALWRKLYGTTQKGRVPILMIAGIAWVAVGSSIIYGALHAAQIELQAVRSDEGVPIGAASPASVDR